MNATTRLIHDYSGLVTWLGECTGLAFPADRLADATDRIGRVMARTGDQDISEFLARIKRGGPALDDLISELTIGESYFFRDPDQFDFIRREVIPEIHRLKGPLHTFRALSAGCASGEEAYSLSILFEQEGLADRSHVTGVDICRAALVKARKAEYASWALRDSDADFRSRYFHQQGDRWVLADSLRKRVSFEFMNLALDVCPSFATGVWGMDIILCRNVLIYFDRATVKDVVRKLVDSLSEGGWLFTGASDPMPVQTSPLEVVQTPVGLAYRRGVGPRLFVTPGHCLSDAASLDVGISVEPTLSVFDQSNVREPRPVDEAPPPGVDRPSDLSDFEEDPLESLLRVFSAGDWARAAELAVTHSSHPRAWAIRARALANQGDLSGAEATAVEGARYYPFFPELHVLRSVLLIALNRREEADRAIRRALYLDRKLAIAHLLHGSLLVWLGKVTAARHAFKNALHLCSARPPDEIVELSDGEPAGRLAEVAAAQIDLLDKMKEVSP